MEIIWIFALLLFFLLCYVIYSSYSFQIWYNRRKLERNFLESFREQVKGIYYKSGHFSPTNKVIFEDEYSNLSNSQKANYSQCYDVITFKTPDSQWELFFYIVKEGMVFTEFLSIRTFPLNSKIKSEANIEKNYSRVNILANNRYLANILESEEVRDTLKWILRETGDNMYVYNNNISFRALIDGQKEKIPVSRVMDMVKSINGIKNKIYKRDVMGY